MTGSGLVPKRDDVASGNDLQGATCRSRHEVDGRDADEERDDGQPDEPGPVPLLVSLVKVLLGDLFGCGHGGPALLGLRRALFKPHQGKMMSGDVRGRFAACALDSAKHGTID
jgi:hypothetical protein